MTGQEQAKMLVMVLASVVIILVAKFRSNNKNEGQYEEENDKVNGEENELRKDGFYYFKTNTYNDFLKKDVEIHSLLLFNKYGFCVWVDDNEKIELNNEDFALFQDFKNDEKTHDVVLKKNKNKIELKMLEEGKPDYRLLSGELINEKLVLKHQKYYFNYALQDYELLTVMDNMVYKFKKMNQ